MGTTDLTTHSAEQSKHQIRVEQMMERAGQDLPDKPAMPDEQVRILRARLILEEALEFCTAAGLDVVSGVGPDRHIVEFDHLTFHVRHEPDLIEMVDGLADLSVVTIGSFSAMGIDDEPVLKEVDQNNLEKFVDLGPCETCRGTGLESETAADAHSNPCPDCKGRKTLGGYRDEHGKWIKPLGHKPPDLASVLKEQEET